MRILHVLDHSLPRHSAYALRTTAIMRQQREIGWHTIHLTGPRQGRSEQDRDHADWHFFRTEPVRHGWCRWPLLRPIGALFQLTRRLAQVARLTRPDILHAHSPALNGLAALRVGRKLGLPVVYELHAAWSDADPSLRNQAERVCERYVVQRADAVTTCSEGLRRRLVAHGIAPDTVTTIPNAVTLRHFRHVPRRDEQLARELGLDAGPVLGFAGTMHVHEGLALLLSVLPALLQTAPTLRLLLVGTGLQEQQLRAMSEALGVQRAVVFAGHGNRERNAALIGLIDLMVYPRLPLPMADLVPARKVLEAMARGRTILASDVGSHRELIDHGRTGMLFEAGNAEALQDALRLLLAERQHWPRLGAAARWHVEYQRTWDIVVARYAPVYSALVAPRRR